jgi:1-aminocyclopropane-1-carboxylate deaminase/D-cysteine desulfhydrase-like pyridoxal-dependent ACC family enzyme
MSSISRWVLEVRWLAGGPQTGRTPDTRIETIRVVDPLFRPAIHIKKLCYELCTKLNISVEMNDSAIHIRDEFYGEDYGIPTPEGREALEFFKIQENIVFENTYPRKTAAALLQGLRSRVLDRQTVLHWNTLNSRNLDAEIDPIDFHDLPDAFYSDFE